jgi:hypothetical protein
LELLLLVWLLLGRLLVVWLRPSIRIVESLVLRGLFLKEWVGLECLGKLLLDSQHVLGFVGIRLSTLIAANREAFTERRERSYSIGLSEGILCRKKKFCRT